MKGSIKLGTIAGIDIFIHWSFSILIAFIVLVNYKNGQNPLQIMWSVFFILCIFATVLLHELGHALAAKKFDIKTKDITLLPIGGLARLVRLPEKPVEELIVAIAGPLVNFFLALVTLLFIDLPNTEQELAHRLSTGVNPSNFFLNFFLVNMLLAVFNLIPAFPMDGGRILRALLSFKLERNKATRIAAKIGQFIAVWFIFFGFLHNFFLIFIGLFVIISAQIEAESVDSNQLLKGFKVRDAVMKQYQTIEAGQKLKKAAELLLKSEFRYLLAVHNEIIVGTLKRDKIINLLDQNGENEIIHNVMNKNVLFIDIDSPLDNVMEQMAEKNSNVMLVQENNELVGTINIENILEFVRVTKIKSTNPNDS